MIIVIFSLQAATQLQRIRRASHAGFLKTFKKVSCLLRPAVKTTQYSCSRHTATFNLRL